MFPERVNGGGATCKHNTSSPDRFTASYRCLAMVAFGPLVTRWQEARCIQMTTCYAYYARKSNDPKETLPDLDSLSPLMC